MESIIYLMHIEWSWIKQRPQYIAEGLTKKYHIEVIFRHGYKRSIYQKRKKKTRAELDPVYLIPGKLEKIPGIKRFNDFLFKNKVKKILKKTNAQKIYITSPTLVKYIPNKFNGKIIFDCMDDYVAMERSKQKQIEVFNHERDLISRANSIIVTSLNLEKIIADKFGVDKKKVFLVRNGFKGPILQKRNWKEDRSNKNTFTISYFGTISTWFDFSILEQSLKKFPNLTYELMGPIGEGTKIPQNPRIKYVGIVEHNQLFKKIEHSSALIMPFKVNQLIESVDPVKLYEYINFDKNILTVRYKEISRFKDFVFFYTNSDEFNKSIFEILNTKKIKYSTTMRTKFLSESSWNNRVDNIIEIIKEM